MLHTKTNDLNKIYILLLAMLVVISSCKVYINEDGSRMLSTSAKQLIFPFGERENRGVITESSEITFEHIDAQELKVLCSKNKVNYVYLWASYCKPCLEKIDTIILTARQEDVNLILIVEDYNIKKIQEILFKNQYFHISYILDAQDYGYKTTMKTKNFFIELSVDTQYVEGYPQQYLINNTGEVIKYAGGGVSFMDFIKEAKNNF